MEEQKHKKNWRERLKHTYRLVIMNEETFEDVASYRLSLLNVYVVLSSIIVLVTIGVVLFIVLTPAKRLIPGYGEANALPELVEMNRELDSLEAALQAQRIYTDHFRRMLAGEVETVQDIQNEPVEFPDSALDIQRIPEDEEIRREVSMAELQTTPVNNDLITRSADLPLEQMYFIAPIRGEISGRFDLDKKHFGIDILAPKDSPIKAVLPGRVISASWNSDTGFTIIIQHANNVVTAYKHNSALLKETGDFVKAGEAVAIIGNTGEQTNGTHLHFELWHNGQAVNPEKYISFH